MSRKIAHELGTSKVRTIDVRPDVETDFKSLLLSENVQKGLQDAGFARPSPIQYEAIPLAKCGLDLLVQAKSGTGKTCVFAVITLEMLKIECNSIQTLIMAPTREIAHQICQVVQFIGKYIEGLKVETFIGGLSVRDDRQKCKRCNVAVGTPGRIKQLIRDGYMKLDSVRLFVLDEVDKLFDDSFQSDINWIYSCLPENKQILTLSATYEEPLVEFLMKYMRNPTLVRLNADDPALLGVSQYFTVIKCSDSVLKTNRAKDRRLSKILSSLAFNQSLIFCNQQNRAEDLCDSLISLGWSTCYISGGQSQKHRLEVMAKLKNMEVKIMTTTDLTARGIDAENIDLIVQIDVPWDVETYLHRTGRAGRYGSVGASIVVTSDGEELDRLIKLRLEKNLKIYKLPENLVNLKDYKATADNLLQNLHPKGFMNGNTNSKDRSSSKVSEPQTTRFSSKHKFLETSSSPNTTIPLDVIVNSIPLSEPNHHKGSDSEKTTVLKSSQHSNDRFEFTNDELENVRLYLSEQKQRFSDELNMAAVNLGCADQVDWIVHRYKIPKESLDNRSESCDKMLSDDELNVEDSFEAEDGQTDNVLNGEVTKTLSSFEKESNLICDYSADFIPDPNIVDENWRLQVLSQSEWIKYTTYFMEMMRID